MAKRRMKDYQVMVAGKGETLITELDRNELMKQLAHCIDFIETIDLLSEKLNIGIEKYRSSAPK